MLALLLVEATAAPPRGNFAVEEAVETTLWLALPAAFWPALPNVELFSWSVTIAIVNEAQGYVYRIVISLFKL